MRGCWLLVSCGGAVLEVGVVRLGGGGGRWSCAGGVSGSWIDECWTGSHRTVLLLLLVCAGRGWCVGAPVLGRGSCRPGHLGWVRVSGVELEGGTLTSSAGDVGSPLVQLSCLWMRGVERGGVGELVVGTLLGPEGTGDRCFW